MVTPDYHGKPIVINKFYTITAKPGPNSVFAGWTGGVNTNLASIKFAAQPNMFMQANFVPNPFPAVKGTYSGLVYDTNGVAQPSAGAFTLTVMAKGGYSGSLQLGGNRYSLSGQFDANGRSVKSFARAKSTVVTVNLQLDLTDGSDTISGSASGNGWAAVLLGDRAVFDAKTHLNPLAGAYTLALDGSYGCPALPGGDSCGALTVSAAGQISLKGSLADGTKITQTAPMSKRGQWPLYAPLYGGQGLILGWLNFNTNAPAEDLTGSLAWLKPSAPKSTYYSHGFTNIADAWGSHYQPPNAFAGAAASLVLSGAALSGGASNRLSIQSNKGQAVDSKKIILTFTPATGLFSGKLAVTNSAKPIVFNGVVLQKRNAGRGYFLQLGATPNDAIVAPNLPVAPVLAKSAQLPPPGQSGEVRLDP